MPQFNISWSWDAAALAAVVVAAAVGIIGLVQYFRGKSVLRPRYVCLFTVAAMVFCLRLAFNGRSYEPLQTVLFSIGDVLRYFALEAANEPLNGLSWEGLDFWLQWLNVLLLVAAPLCTATLFLRLLRGQWRRVKLSVLFWRPVYYFSELNEKSFALAQSICTGADSGNWLKKPALVFCKDAAEGTPALRKHAERLGAVFFRSHIHAIPLERGKRRDISIFFIDLQEEENVLSLLRMKDKLPSEQKQGGKQLQVYLCSTLASAEPIVDSLNENASGYRIHLVHETRMAVQKLLLEKPLYGQASESKKISLLIVGGGSVGTEVMKAAMVCGIMRDYSLSVKVIDRDAEQLKARFYRDYDYEDMENGPKTTARWNAIKPEFITAEATGKQLETALEACGDSTYIVVATGDDERNCDIASYISRWHVRRSEIQPQIHVVIRNSERCGNMSFREKNIQSFGCNTEIFNLEDLLQRKLDRAAALFRMGYDDDFQPDWLFDPEQLRRWEEALLQASVVHQYSNQIAALHSIYKVQMLLQQQAGEKTPAELVKELTGKLEADMDALLTLEHERWSVFHILDGWKPCPIERLEDLNRGLALKDKVTKDEDNKLHGCLIDADMLYKLEDSTGKSEAKFDGNDFKIWAVTPFAWLMLHRDEGYEATEELKQSARELWAAKAAAEATSEKQKI